MKPSILLLTQDKIITNRAVINNLWCRIIPQSGVSVFWVAEFKGKYRNKIIKSGNLFILLFCPSSSNNIIITNFFSIIYKFRLSNFLARSNFINQIQARNGITDGLICLVLKLVYGLPYSFHLSSLHGFEDNSLISSQYGLQKVKFKFRILLYPFLYKIIMRYASVVQPISKYMGDYLVKKAKINANKIFPIPVSSTRKEIYLEEGKELSSNSIIVYVGSLGKERDIEFMLRIFSSISNDKPQIRFRILGIVEKNTNLEVLEEMLDRLGIKKSTELFLDIPFSQVRNLISDCEIGISPIKPTNKYIVSTPTKVIEYLSCGLPVVCNNEIFDHEYVIRQSNGGFAVPYSVKHFKNAIMSILNDKELYSKMSKEGRQWIFDNRTYDDLSVSLIQKYKELVNPVIR